MGGRGTLGTSPVKAISYADSTLVRMAAGGVAVFSPVALTPDVKKKVSSLGELKYITAPDFEVILRDLP